MIRIPRFAAFLAILGALSGCATAPGGATASSSLQAPLELQDMGSFFLHQKTVHSAYPNVPAVGLTAPGQITVNQMYVQYFVPRRVQGLPVILVHGANHTGKTFETTPDGREGWATYLVRRGFPVYVVDHAGRGRSGFDARQINETKATGRNPEGLPAVLQYSREGGWVNFRFGPRFGTAHPNGQFPTEALDQYMAQIVPNTESFLEGRDANTAEALAELADRIGPAFLLVHSQSGGYGLEVVRRSRKLAGLLSVEGNCAPLSPQDLDGPFRAVPLVSVWGDNSVGAAGFNGDARRNGCVQSVRALQDRGADAELLLLPERGIAGNSHMMMMDRNNLQVAGLLVEWMAKRGRR
jgi:pimeloyl-ACP methyl ester carboxylesterase